MVAKLMRKISKLIACALVLLGAIPSAAHAQEESGGGFCASAPSELLSAIDGNWTFKQGAGGGLGAVIPFPLPAHPPQSVKIDVDEELGIATLKHAGRELAIIPIAADQVKGATELLNQADADELIDTKGACNWYSLPLMLGSDTYMLDPAMQPDTDTFIFVRTIDTLESGQPIGVTHIFCKGGIQSMTDWSIYDPDAEGQLAPDVYVHEVPQGEYPNSCWREPDPREPKPGEMTMNLLVKFNSPNSGSGILLFMGEMDGYKFAARAPVTLTR